MKKTEPRLKKITINIPTKLYNEINNLAIENGLTFTGQAIAIFKNGIDQNNTVKYLPQILEQLLNERERTKKTKTSCK